MHRTPASSLLARAASVPRDRWSTAARTLVYVMALFTTTAARACPDCDAGRIARYRFFTDGFALNLAVLLVPFVVIAFAALAADRFGRPRLRHVRGEEVSE